MVHSFSTNAEGDHLVRGALNDEADACVNALGARSGNALQHVFYISL
jgi:hypothetical protein